MATLADLEALIGMPTVNPPSVDWLRLENISGLIFPEDYKEFASRYGMLEVEAFLDVNHPGMPGDPEAKIRESREMLEPIRILASNRNHIYLRRNAEADIKVAPFPIYPEIGGLFPWGA